MEKNSVNLPTAETDAAFIPPFTMGVDSGSLTAKAVIMDANRRIVSHSVVQLGFVSQEAVRKVIQEVLQQACQTIDDISYIVSTGYGRRRLEVANKSITEVSCHAKGAHFLMPDVRTVIDIGGQDSKVMALENNGDVKNFAMNDRCAAGTGQFLEVMARALEVDVREAGAISLKSTNELKISNVCTVFAETEVISLVAQGHDKTDILASIHQAIARRVGGMVARVGLKEPVMMSGGVANNIGVVKALEKELGVPLSVHRQCQVVGAIGAALYAADNISGAG